MAPKFSSKSQGSGNSGDGPKKPNQPGKTQRPATKQGQKKKTNSDSDAESVKSDIPATGPSQQPSTNRLGKQPEAEEGGGKGEGPLSLGLAAVKAARSDFEHAGKNASVEQSSATFKGLAPVIDQCKPARKPFRGFRLSTRSWADQGDRDGKSQTG